MEEHDYIEIDRQSDFPGQDIFIKQCIAPESGNIWHRAVIKAQQAVVFLFASDDMQEEPVFGVRDERLSGDYLLDGYQGKYMYVKVECQSADAKFWMKLYPYRHNFIRYLPEVYQTVQQSDFMHRFLALFQSIYLDVEEQITDLTSQLDPASRRMRAENLRALASWLSADEFLLLSEEKGRQWLLTCVKFYRMSGTLTGLKQMIHWYLGQSKGQIFVVEHAQIERFLDQSAVQRHYGDKPYMFTVILWQANCSGMQQRVLERLLRAMKPAYCEERLVILANRICLDAYTYVGMNSYLGTYERPVLDDSHYLTRMQLFDIEGVKDV